MTLITKNIVSLVGIMIIIIFYAIYSSKNIKQKNENNKSTLVDEIYYKIQKDTSIPNIIKSCKQSIGLQHGSKYINSIIKNEKIAFMLIGENGTGKTTTCFKLAKFFNSKNKKPIVVNIDNFKQPKDFFNKQSEKHGIDTIEFQSNKKIKQCIKESVNIFSKKEHGCLIIDTSGRNMENKNLNNEIKSAMNVFHELCQHKNIKGAVIKTININHKNIIDGLNYDYLIINYLDMNSICEHVINCLYQNKENKILFTNSNNNINNISIFAPNIIYKMFAIFMSKLNTSK